MTLEIKQVPETMKREWQEAAHKAKSAGIHPSRVTVFLKPGTVVRAANCDYIVGEGGSWRRADTRRWDSKAERKRYKKAMRASRNSK